MLNVQITISHTHTYIHTSQYIYYTVYSVHYYTLYSELGEVGTPDYRCAGYLIPANSAERIEVISISRYWG